MKILMKNSLFVFSAGNAGKPERDANSTAKNEMNEKEKNDEKNAGAAAFFIGRDGSVERERERESERERSGTHSKPLINGLEDKRTVKHTSVLSKKVKN